jgi:hypothetical protein
MLNRLIPALFAALLCGPCLAREVKLGETNITLTSPPGQCELDRGVPGDARLLQAVETAIGGNRLLAMYAECRQHADWRAGKRGLLEDFAQYQVAPQFADAPPEPAPEQALKQLCATLRADGERLMAGLAPDMKARIEQAVRNAQVNQTRFLGVVAEEPAACYSAMAQRLKAETGKDVTIIGLFAATYVRGKLVYYYLYSPYRSTQTVTTLLARQKRNVAALLEANKKVARAPGRGGGPRG